MGPQRCPGSAAQGGRDGRRLQQFGDKGIDRLGERGLIGTFATNYRMSEPQAAVAAAQLERVESIAERRSRLADLLNDELAGRAGIERPRVRRGNGRGSHPNRGRSSPSCSRARIKVVRLRA